MSEQSDDDDDDEIPTLLNLDLLVKPEGKAHLPEVQTSNAGTEKDNDDEIPLVPVTILSGFLGSGKTSLIQHILRSPHHKKKIAVIENEFSGTSAAYDDGTNIKQQGLSIETLIARDGSDNLNNLTDLIELPNGCLCCTVKDSLVATLENLLSKKRELDYIIIECSGMANPGPIASVFWLDDALESQIRLDGVVTCVDARNFEMQLWETNSRSAHHGESGEGQDTTENNDSAMGGDEAAQQIAFADRIIINKVDLLEKVDEQVANVIGRIREINATAPIRQTTFSRIMDLDWILDAKCFDIERAKEAEMVFSAITKEANESGRLVEGQPPFCAPCDKAPVNILPRTADDHRHTSSICTIALIEHGSIYLKKMNSWLASILWPDQDQSDSVLTAQLLELERLGKITTPKLVEQRHKQVFSGKMQIFRIKGILSVKHSITDDNTAEDDLGNFIDEDYFDRRKFIVQAVNDLWDIHAASESLSWGSDKSSQVRVCKLVVIGRYLDRSALTSGFRSCLA